MGRQPDYRVLFSNLGDKDGGAVVAQLSQMNVPYKYSEGGGAILIPAERVHDVRLRLATQGLPKGSVAGFELMESNKFGMTQFQERLNFQRGPGGGAHPVHSSACRPCKVPVCTWRLPNQNGFFREQQKPSASVLVSLHPGRILDRAQLAGIVHLVASSVPELAPSAVSVLDDTGKLLSQSPDSTAGAETVSMPSSCLYVQQLEQQYSRRIMDILEPVVGRDNVKAQVTAEVDFSHRPSPRPSSIPPQPDATDCQRRTQPAGAGKHGAARRKTLPTGVPGAPRPTSLPAPSAAPINGANPPRPPPPASRLRAPKQWAASANPSPITRLTRRCASRAAAVVPSSG